MADSKPFLRITNNAREGYRRAGVVFAKGANEMAAAAFNADQLATLEADPHLTVEVLDTVEPGEATEAEGPVVDGGVGDAVKPKAKKAKGKNA